MSTFSFKELTIDSFHKGLLNKEVTSEELVKYYLDRLEKLDKQGPKLLSVITVNHKAMEEARELDEYFAKTGELIGPLHGVPLMLKDNIDAKGLPTSAGSVSLKDNIAREDAFLSAKLKEAGAIVLAKTNLHEFAMWGESISSLLGQTLNPYDLTRTPGGSSGGTGASIGADIGILGIGTDTINSIRNPASANSLCGIRPTLGYVSRSGIIPYSLTQDTAGPICRTVADCVETLDIIGGYDPQDPMTARFVKQLNGPLKNHLLKEGLKGKRIGVLESFFGKEEVNEGTNQVVRKAMKAFEENGATLISLNDVIDSNWVVENVSVHFQDFRDDLNSYLEKLPADYPVHSLQDIIDSGTVYPRLKETMEMAQNLEISKADYNERLLLQEELRLKVLTIMADHDLDAIAYPHQQQLVCKAGENQLQRNGVLCSATGFPSFVVPAGFAPSKEAPIGVPVGMEIIGRPFSEPVLTEIAYAFEQATHYRKPPVNL